MKNSLLGRRIQTPKSRNGAKVQPSFQARVRYGARLRRAVERAQEQIQRSIRLTSVRREFDGLRCLE
jgi:hypothetical protein